MYNDVYIDSIRMINCQSWRDETLSFSQGLNVICAGNGVGKSVIFKVLKLVLNPLKHTSTDRTDIIRNDSMYAEVFYLFSDSSVYHILIEKDRLRYFYIDNISNPAQEFVGEYPPEDLIRKIGSLVRGELVSNIIDMDQSKFLVDSSEDTNHSMLSVLTEHEDLDKVVNSLERDRIPSSKSLLTQAIQKRSIYNSTMNKFSYVDITTLDYNLEFCESILPILDTLLTSDELLSDIMPSATNLEDLTLFVDLLEYSNELANNLSSVKEIKCDVEIVELCVNLLEEIILYNKGLSKITKSMFSDYKHVSEILNTVEIISIANENLSNYKEIKDTTQSSNILNFVEGVAEVSTPLSKITKPKDVSGCENILNLVKELDVITSSISRMTNITLLEDEISKLNAELNDNGGVKYDCPIYGRILHINNECIPNS